MGRRPKLRASFNDDAAFLLRLARAIEHDVSMPRVWRAETHEMVMGLARHLMTAPPRSELPEPIKRRKRSVSG